MRSEIEFWNNVDKSGKHWMWKSPPTKGGYGQLNWHGKVRTAHTVAYELRFGPIPLGKIVMHSCNIKLCMLHIKAGTYGENNQDALNDGLRKPIAPHKVRGSANGNSYLEDHEVRQIRKLANQGYSQRNIASRFNVGKTTVAKIIHRELWAHLE